MVNANTAEQLLYLPPSMVQHIQREASRLDRSPSACVQSAWQIARAELTRLEPLDVHPGAEGVYQECYKTKDPRVKQTLVFPLDMQEEIEAEAARQDRSLSWLVQRAWCLASKEISALPSVKLPS